MCITVIGILQFNCIRLKGGHIKHLWYAVTDTYVCFLQNLCLLLKVSEEIADPCLTLSRSKLFSSVSDSIMHPLWSEPGLPYIHHNKRWHFSPTDHTKEDT